MPESSKVFMDNSRIKDIHILENPISKLEHNHTYQGTDTYFRELPDECQLTKRDRDNLRVFNNSEGEGDGTN